MTFPPIDHEGRRQRVESALEHPALLVTNPVNIRWLTGFTGSYGTALVTATGSLLMTDGRYIERVRATAPGLDCIESSSPHEDVVAWLRDRGIHVLGLEGDHVSWASASRWQRTASESDVEIVPTSGVIEAHRAVKEPAEIDRLGAACRITVDVLADVFARLRPGHTERQVRAWLEDGFIAAGADGRAFDSIVAAGPNGARPHHEATDRAIEAGELVTIDCGARVDGYHADCTRTVAVGTPDAGLADLHALVCRAQAAGREAVRPGVAGQDVDQAARSVITAAGHGEAFIHGTGHGVGLEIHEPPAISARATSTLASGMTVTVEPGVYLPGTGGVRVEDTVLVTPEGHQVLTDLPHDLLVLQG